MYDLATNTKIVDLSGKLKIHNISHYILSIDLWEKFEKKYFDVIKESNWVTFKCLENGKPSSEFDNIPSDKGGIYTFFIQAPILKDRVKVLIYIGRAQKKKVMNLKRRVNEYVPFLLNLDYSRPIQEALYYWHDYIYCRYLPLDNDNKFICALEDALINAMVPPYNPKITNVVVSRAVQAVLRG